MAESVTEPTSEITAEGIYDMLSEDSSGTEEGESLSLRKEPVKEPAKEEEPEKEVEAEAETEEDELSELESELEAEEQSEEELELITPVRR